MLNTISTDMRSTDMRSNDRRAIDMRREEMRRFRPSRSCAYEGWTVVELKKRARQLRIDRYSGLNKEELIELIRQY